MITTTENTTTAKLSYRHQPIHDTQTASMNTEPVPNGVLKGCSDALGLYLCWLVC